MCNIYYIAGLYLEMDTFGRTKLQSEPYISLSKASVNLKILSNANKMMIDQPHLSLDDAEYISTGSSFYRQLLDFNGLMLHSSAVVVDGKAYLFSANSGTGKSTHTQLWLNTFGDRAFLLNDDKPALRLEDGVWYAYGTPWSGKYDISRNERVPLAGIAFLERGEENQIEPFKGTEAIHAFLEQTLRPNSVRVRFQLLELLDKLFSSVPVWKLRCNMDPSAAIVSYEAMSGEKYHN